MAKKVRVGVIGAGSWAISSHIPNFKARPEVDLVVACRVEGHLAERVKDTFGFQYATTDYKEVLEHELDIVLVSSPAGFHYEHAKAALESGAHVLCEKPFTVNSADAWDLVHTAKKNDRHLVISYGWNYRPMIVKAKRIMEESGVGNIEAVMVHMASPCRELLKSTGAYIGSADKFAPDPNTWTDPKLSGGGYAQAQLSHALGLSLWLTDLRGEDVFARVNNVGARVDLYDAFSVKYNNGAIGTIFGASNPAGANKHQLEVRIYGDNGQMMVDVEREWVWLFRSPEEQIILDLKSDEGTYDCIGPVDTIVDLALGKDVVNHTSADLGARTVELLETAYKSAASGKPEKVTV